MNLPTAEEILLKHSTTLTDGSIYCSHGSREKAMIEFAKLHCEAQQKAIIEKALIDANEDDLNNIIVTINSDSILNSYSLTLIK